MPPEEPIGVAGRRLDRPAKASPVDTQLDVTLKLAGQRGHMQAGMRFRAGTVDTPIVEPWSRGAGSCIRISQIITRAARDPSRQSIYSLRGSSPRHMAHRTIAPTTELGEHPHISCCENEGHDVRLAGSAPASGRTQQPGRPRSSCKSLCSRFAQLLRKRFYYRKPCCPAKPRHSRIVFVYYIRVASHTGYTSHQEVDTPGIEPKASRMPSELPLHHVPMPQHIACTAARHR